MIRLIALDVDGTLLGDTPEVSAAVRAALVAAVEAGAYVTLATARSYFNARKLAGQLGLSAPLIVHAGALVRDPVTEQTLFARTVPRALAVAIAAFCDDQALPMITTLPGRTYLRTDGPLPALPAHVRTPERIAPFLAGETEEPLSLIVQGEPAIARVLAQFAAPLAGELVFSRAYNGDGTAMLNLTASGANKGTALAALGAALGIGPEETMAAGDADVDVPMFAVAALSVAMGNAAPDVQAWARVIAPAVADDGVAWAIRRFVLEGVPLPERAVR